MEIIQSRVQGGEEFVEIDISMRHLFMLVLSLVIIFSFISYLAYNAYQEVRLEQVVQKKLLEDQAVKQEEQLKLAQAKIEEAEKGVKQTQENINVTISDITESLKKAPATVIVREQNTSTKDDSISARDLEPLMAGVGQILCKSPKGDVNHGSGSVWTFKETGPAVVTNLHVVDKMLGCVILFQDNSNKVTGMFALEGTVYTYNTNTDAAVVTLGKSLTDSTQGKEAYIGPYQNMRACPHTLEVGSPLVVIGFPSYAKRDINIDVPQIGKIPQIFRTVTNGIVSGFDTSVTSKGLLKNFFVSAKIDSGNSGGISVSKDSKGVCLLGLPSWLSVGSYENTGLVQNIRNVIPSN